ncbi:hypothetical protein VTH06DRAFT_6011 [Thermothelomyces fergusii]
MDLVPASPNPSVAELGLRDGPRIQ